MVAFFLVHVIYHGVIIFFFFQAVDNPAYEFSLLQVSGASSCWHLHHLSTQRYSGKSA